MAKKYGPGASMISGVGRVRMQRKANEEGRERGEKKEKRSAKTRK